MSRPRLLPSWIAFLLFCHYEARLVFQLLVTSSLDLFAMPVKTTVQAEDSTISSNEALSDVDDTITIRSNKRREDQAEMQDDRETGESLLIVGLVLPSAPASLNVPNNTDVRRQTISENLYQEELV